MCIVLAVETFVYSFFLIPLVVMECILKVKCLVCVTEVVFHFVLFSVSISRIY